MYDQQKVDGKPRSATTKLDLPQDLQIEQDDLIIFGEDGKFYVVPKRQYTAVELPSALLSAPEFVVGLGSVVSDITAFARWDDASDLMDRCKCVVVNVAAIRQVSEKQEPLKAVTFIKDPAYEKQEDKKPLGPEETPHCLHVSGRKLDRSVKPGPSDLVIFDEDKKFYWVKKEEYESPTNELPSELRGAPEFMVKMGSVVADIPSLPTAGCACRLVNLASVRKGSGYAARLLEEGKLDARFHKFNGGGSPIEALKKERETVVRQSDESEEAARAKMKELREKVHELEAVENTRKRDAIQRKRYLRAEALRKAQAEAAATPQAEVAGKTQSEKQGYGQDAVASRPPPGQTAEGPNSRH